MYPHTPTPAYQERMAQVEVNSYFPPAAEPENVHPGYRAEQHLVRPSIVGGMALREFTPRPETHDTGGHDGNYALRIVADTPENSWNLDPMATYRRRMGVIERLRDMQARREQPPETTPLPEVVSPQGDQGTLAAKIRALGGLRGHDANPNRGLGEQIGEQYPIDMSPAALARRRAAYAEHLRYQAAAS